MPTFSAPDGTELAYRFLGDPGPDAPLICLPGGPMQDAAYLGDLGELTAHRQLIVLDLRGTGDSATPADPSSYRCDRLVGDVEALREHLGLDRIELLGHSAGANLAVRYAERIAERIARLALIAPSTRAVGIPVTGETRREVARLHEDEPWFAEAFAAYERIGAGRESDADWVAISPFNYGRWDAAAQAHAGAADEQEHEEAAEAFMAEGAFDPDTTRAALAAFPAPVLLLAGELDWGTTPRHAAEYAALFPHARVVVQPGAGHLPWVSDPAWFASAVGEFLAA